MSGGRGRERYTQRAQLRPPLATPSADKPGRPVARSMRRATSPTVADGAVSLVNVTCPVTKQLIPYNGLIVAL